MINTPALYADLKNCLLTKEQFLSMALFGSRRRRCFFRERTYFVYSEVLQVGFLSSDPHVMDKHMRYAFCCRLIKADTVLRGFNRIRESGDSSLYSEVGAVLTPAGYDKLIEEAVYNGDTFNLFFEPQKVVSWSLRMWRLYVHLRIQRKREEKAKHGLQPQRWWPQHFQVGTVVETELPHIAGQYTVKEVVSYGDDSYMIIVAPDSDAARRTVHFNIAHVSSIVTPGNGKSAYQAPEVRSYGGLFGDLLLRYMGDLQTGQTVNLERMISDVTNGTHPWSVYDGFYVDGIKHKKKLKKWVKQNRNRYLTSEAKVAAQQAERDTQDYFDDAAENEDYPEA